VATASILAPDTRSERPAPSSSASQVSTPRTVRGLDRSAGRARAVLQHPANGRRFGTQDRGRSAR